MTRIFSMIMLDDPSNCQLPHPYSSTLCLFGELYNALKAKMRCIQYKIFCGCSNLMYASFTCLMWLHLVKLERKKWMRPKKQQKLTSLQKLTRFSWWLHHNNMVHTLNIELLIIHLLWIKSLGIRYCFVCWEKWEKMRKWDGLS